MNEVRAGDVLSQCFWAQVKAQAGGKGPLVLSLEIAPHRFDFGARLGRLSFGGNAPKVVDMLEALLAYLQCAYGGLDDETRAFMAMVDHVRHAVLYTEFEDGAAWEQDGLRIQLGQAGVEITVQRQNEELTAEVADSLEFFIRQAAERLALAADASGEAKRRTRTVDLLQLSSDIAQAAIDGRLTAYERDQVMEALAGIAAGTHRLAPADESLEDRVFKSAWPEGLKERTSYRIVCDDKGRTGSTYVEVFVAPDGDAHVVMQDWENFPKGMPSALPSARIRTGNGGGRSMRTRQALLWLAQAIRLDNAENGRSNETGLPGN